MQQPSDPVPAAEGRLVHGFGGPVHASTPAASAGVLHAPRCEQDTCESCWYGASGFDSFAKRSEEASLIKRTFQELVRASPSPQALLLGGRPLSRGLAVFQAEPATPSYGRMMPYAAEDPVLAQLRSHSSARQPLRLGSLAGIPESIEQPSFDSKRLPGRPIGPSPVRQLPSPPNAQPLQIEAAPREQQPNAVSEGQPTKKRLGWLGAFPAFQPDPRPHEGCQPSEETELSEEELHEAAEADESCKPAALQNLQAKQGDSSTGLVPRAQLDAAEEGSSGSAEQERGTFYGGSQAHRSAKSAAPTGLSQPLASFTFDQAPRTSHPALSPSKRDPRLAFTAPADQGAAMPTECPGAQTERVQPPLEVEAGRPRKEKAALGRAFAPVEQSEDVLMDLGESAPVEDYHLSPIEDEPHSTAAQEAEVQPFVGAQENGADFSEIEVEPNPVDEDSYPEQAGGSERDAKDMKTQSELGKLGNWTVKKRRSRSAAAELAQKQIRRSSRAQRDSQPSDSGCTPKSRAGLQPAEPESPLDLLARAAKLSNGTASQGHEHQSKASNGRTGSARATSDGLDTQNEATSPGDDVILVAASSGQANALHSDPQLASDRSEEPSDANPVPKRMSKSSHGVKQTKAKALSSRKQDTRAKAKQAEAARKEEAGLSAPDDSAAAPTTTDQQQSDTSMKSASRQRQEQSLPSQEPSKPKPAAKGRPIRPRDLAPKGIEEAMRSPPPRTKPVSRVPDSHPQLQVLRTGRVRAAPVAFWANQSLRLDGRSGKMAVVGGFADQLTFGSTKSKPKDVTKRGSSVAGRASSVAPRAPKAAKAKSNAEAKQPNRQSPTSPQRQKKQQPPEKQEKPEGQLRGGMSLAQAALVAGRAAAKASGAKPDTAAKPNRQRLQSREQPGNSLAEAAADSDRPSDPKASSASETSRELLAKASKLPPKGKKAAQPPKRSRLNLVSLPEDDAPGVANAALTRQPAEAPEPAAKRQKTGSAAAGQQKAAPCATCKKGHKPRAFCGTLQATRSCLKRPVSPPAATKIGSSRVRVFSKAAAGKQAGSSGPGSDGWGTNAELPSVSEAEEAASDEDLEGDGWNGKQLAALQAAVCKVDPRAPDFWRQVSKAVGGGKSAIECSRKHTAQFGETPAPKLPKPRTNEAAAASTKLVPGKKPTKVQARKLAREARLEQRIDGRPAGQDAMPRQPMQMQQRTDRYMDILLRRPGIKGMASAGFGAAGPQQPAKIPAASIRTLEEEIEARLTGMHEEVQERDEADEDDHYFSDE